VPVDLRPPAALRRRAVGGVQDLHVTCGRRPSTGSGSRCPRRGRRKMPTARVPVTATRREPSSIRPAHRAAVHGLAGERRLARERDRGAVARHLRDAQARLPEARFVVRERVDVLAGRSSPRRPRRRPPRRGWLVENAVAAGAGEKSMPPLGWKLASP
jgi:hypothetical protein